MSYAEKLYDNIALANQHAFQGKKAVDELLSFFKLIVNADENYAKVLENISNFQFLLLRGSMLEAALALKHDISNKAVQIRAFVENMAQDIIKPLQTLQNFPIEQAKILSAEAQKIIKIKESYYEKLTKQKEKFWKSCNECEKITQTLEQPQSQNLREKYLEKLIKHKDSLDSDLKLYKDQIDSWDRVISNYKALMKPVLESYEKNELYRLGCMKDQLRKFIVYEASYIRNLQYEIDSLASCMENLDIQKDLETLVFQVAQPVPPEFEAYKGSHPAYKNVSSSGLLFAIPLPIQDPKWSEIVFQGSIEDMYKTEIDIITLKACQGYDLVSEDFVQFNSLIKDSLGRKAWIWSMNLKKSSSLLTDKGYIQLGELMLSILNEVIYIQCERTQDFYTIKSTLIFASIFYKDSGSKLNLIKLISSHSLWSRFDIWDKVVEISITEEINSRDAFNFTSKEEDKKKILRNIVFCQLGIIAEFMNAFNLHQLISTEIITKYSHRYELTSEDHSVLMATISVKKEKEPSRVLKVQRGIPAWLQEIEGSAAAIAKRSPKTLSEYITPR